MKHTEPWNLFPVSPEYDSARYISALRPDTDCQDSCQFGYCTTYPALLKSGDLWQHRDGDLFIYQYGQSYPAPEELSSSNPVAGQPQCECFPDVSEKKTPSEDNCRPKHPAELPQCLDSCSFAGNCTRGFCSCLPGFWGSGMGPVAFSTLRCIQCFPQSVK